MVLQAIDAASHTPQKMKRMSDDVAAGVSGGLRDHPLESSIADISAFLQVRSMRTGSMVL